MCRVISVSNQKGGVGKTTTSGILSCCLIKNGFRTLAVDLDPQGNLTFSLNGDSELAASIYDVFTGEVRPQHAVQRLECCDLISSSILLSGVELEHTNAGREFLLRDALAPLKAYYDFIVVDTPPNLGILTINAFACSDYIIVPVLSDIFSLQGLAQLHDSVQHIKAACNPDVKFLGIVLTRYNARTVLNREILGTAQMIAQSLDIPMFNTRIRSSIAVCEAQSAQISLLKYAPANQVVRDYFSLASEIQEKVV